MTENIRRCRSSELIITNETLDEAYVQSLVIKLRQGTIRDHFMGAVLVNEGSDGKLRVNDGNHFVRACQITQIEWVLAQIYVLSE